MLAEIPSRMRVYSVVLDFIFVYSEKKYRHTRGEARAVGESPR